MAGQAHALMGGGGLVQALRKRGQLAQQRHARREIPRGLELLAAGPW